MTLIKFFLIVLLMVIPLSTMGQLTYPEKDGDKVCYNLQIEIRESYVSGICIMVNNDGLIMSSIVNEFGVSMIDFTYSENKNKVKIRSVIGSLNRWYVKRLIKRSLRGMLKAMKFGDTEYIDTKNKIRYIFTLNNGTQG